MELCIKVAKVSLLF